MAPAQAPPEESSSAQIVPSPRCTSPGADPPQRPRTDPPAAPQPEGDPLSSRMVKRMLEEGEREVEQFMKGYLSAPKLRQLTAMDDLKDVRYLEMTVDTSSMSLNNFGEMVPSLEQLKLNNSMIRSLRDLGSSLEGVHVLWMARCGLSDFSGPSALASLRELYLAFNNLCDISSLSMLEHLEILDLEGNNVDSYDQVEHLSLCEALVSLTLQDNPVQMQRKEREGGRAERAPSVYAPEAVDEMYRTNVLRLLPQLRYLDDEPVTAANREDAPADGPGSPAPSERSKGKDLMCKTISALKTDGQIPANHLYETADKSPRDPSRPHTAQARYSRWRQPGKIISRAASPDRDGESDGPLQRVDELEADGLSRDNSPTANGATDLASRTVSSTTRPQRSRRDLTTAELARKRSAAAASAAASATAAAPPAPGSGPRHPRVMRHPHRLEPLEGPLAAHTLERLRPILSSAVLPRSISVRLLPIPPAGPPPPRLAESPRHVHLRARAAVEVPNRIGLARSETARMY